MLLLLQNVLYCLLYASLIKCAVRNDGRNCLYFYPKEYIEEAQKRGIADKETVMKRSKWFMIPFCIIIFVVLILIISVWNHVMDFKTAYLQACLFLVVMNWFDGIVIDRLWVPLIPAIITKCLSMFRIWTRKFITGVQKKYFDRC